MQNAGVVRSAWGKMNFIVRRGTESGVAGIEPLEGGEREPSVRLLQFRGVPGSPGVGFVLPLGLLSGKIGSEQEQACEGERSKDCSRAPGNHRESIRCAGVLRGSGSTRFARSYRVRPRLRDFTSTMALQTEERGVEFGEVGGEAVVTGLPFFAAFSDADAHYGEVLRLVWGIGEGRKMIAEKRGGFGSNQTATIFHRQHCAQHSLVLRVRLAEVKVRHDSYRMRGQG